MQLENAPLKKVFISGFYLVLCSNIIQVSKQGGIFGAPEALYGPDDHVVVLNATNIKKTIYGTNNAWIVEFFSSWCGHCIHFAPIYKQFAAETESWKNVVRVAGIDCADENNVATCREFEIMGYPTVLFFPPHSKELKAAEKPEEKPELNRGQTFRRSDKVSELKSELMEMVTPHFPNILGDVSSVENTLTSFNAVWKYVKKGSSSSQPTLIVLLFESEKQSVGKELALRLSFFPEIRVIRFFKKNSLYNRLGIKDEWPAAGYLKQNLQNGIIPILKNRNIVSSLQSSILRLIHQTDNKASNPAVPSLQIDSVNTGGNKEEEKVINKNNEQANNLEEPSPSPHEDVVSLEDLIHAVRNSLRNEVGVLKTVEGWKLKVLKEYIHLLGKMFPSDRREFAVFLMKLGKWVDSQGSQVQVNVYLDKLTELELELHPWDIETNAWGNCKGTVPGRRGYTCSLWRLFHTMTILSTQRAQEVSVLPVIHGYVKEFFGCTECVKHFTKMVDDEGALTITSARAQALWLWKAHNKVNLRLKGSTSEDPGYPKGLYPSETQCTSCYNPEGSFDEDKVFEYLVSVYSQPVRTLQKERKADSHSQQDPKALPISRREAPLQQSKFFSGTDYWIFCIVYISVAALLIFGYVHFKLGYRRRLDPFGFCRKVIHTTKSMV